MPICFAKSDMHNLRELFRELHGHGGPSSRSGCRGAAHYGCSADLASVFAAQFLRGQRIDFHSTDDAYFAFVRVPGLERSSLKVQLSEGCLKIMKAASPDQAGPSQAPSGDEPELLGSYELPEDVFTDGIFAKLEDGELFISLPKQAKEETPIFEVPIEEAESRPAASEDAWVDVSAGEGGSGKEDKPEISLK